MSNAIASPASVFASMFIVPAIPEEITGKNDVALKGAALLDILTGEGNSPELKGRALLAAIAESAFDAGGKAFQRLSGEGAKGNKRRILTALYACPSLPACKGGKNPRPLLKAEVEAFLDAFAAALGEKKEVVARAPSLPDLAKFIERFGARDAHAFAVALLAATDGVLKESATPLIMPEKLAA